jgi:hypothetical protein
VHDEQGRKIAGAHITINGWRKTTSNEDGRFELPVPSGNDSRPLCAHAPGYAQRLVPTNIPAGATEYELAIELQPGARWAGRVVDESGAPVAGATVKASGLFHGTETDNEGRFVLHSAAPESRHELSARKPGYQRGTTACEAGREDIEIILRPGHAIALRVLGLDGRGLAGATVMVMTGPSGWQRRGFTDRDGSFRLTDLEPGSLSVIVEKRGLVRAWQPVEVPFSSGELVIRMQRGHTVRGTVVDTQGNPIAGASVYGQTSQGLFGLRDVGTRANSTADGSYEITDLPLEPLTLYAHKPSYARAAVELTGGAPGGITDVELRMTPAPSLAGQVLDGTTGKPVEEFTVHVTAGPDSPPLHMDPMLVRDSKGFWRAQNFRVQAATELRVGITAPGYAPARVKTAAAIDPPADQTVVRLFRGVTVHGIVRRAGSGKPLDGVTVRLLAADALEEVRPGELGLSARTDAAGAFSIESAPPGNARLDLRHPELPGATFGPFEIGRGPGSLEVHPEMAAGIRLSGRLLGFDDLRGLAVSARRLDYPRTHSAVLHPDQSFDITGLGTGIHVLEARTAAGYSRSIRVEVGDRDLDGVVINARAGTGSIQARVLGLDRGWAQVIAVTGAHSERYPTHWFPFVDGTFAVGGLAIGRHRVSVHADGSSRSKTVEVDVGAGKIPLRIEVDGERAATRQR